MLWLVTGLTKSFGFFQTPVQKDPVNYVKTFSTNKEGITEPDYDLPAANGVTSTVFIDGLGRTLQNVIRQNTPQLKDVVQIMQYDDFGREKKAYLPYASNESDGRFKTNASTLQSQFYSNNPNQGWAQSAFPFSDRKFENSPLNRVSMQGAPGEDWQPVSPTSPVLKMFYKTNSTADQVIQWQVVNGRPDQMQYYDQGDLYKNVMIDEEDGITEEFLDQQGRVLLKKVLVESNTWALTYYIYDDLENLRFVLPPEASDRLATEYFPGNSAARKTFLDTWSFQYRYDKRQRLTEKRVPGAGWMHMVYDQRDRLVLSQDSVQRTNAQWLFTKYDVLNRPVLTGIYASAADRITAQGLVDNGSNQLYESLDNIGTHGYTNLAFPQSSISEYLSVTYYDTYDFLAQADFGSAYQYDNTQLTAATVAQGTYSFPGSAFDRINGQITGAKTKVLNSSNWLRTVSYYDDRYRAIQVISSNHLGGIDKVSSVYGFSGWLLKSRGEHNFPGRPVMATEQRFIYDHAGRLSSGYHQLFEGGVGKGEVLLAENVYNPLGELIEKNLHVEAGTPHQSLDYRYNIRGWLKSINSSNLQITTGVNENDAQTDLFGMEIFYNTLVNGVNSN